MLVRSLVAAVAAIAALLPSPAAADSVRSPLHGALDPGPHRVGFTIVTFKDVERPMGPKRDPGGAPVDMERLRRFLGEFGTVSDDAWRRLMAMPLLAARDATPAGGRFPLLIGHLRDFSTTVTNEYLGSHGYVVAMASSPDQLDAALARDPRAPVFTESELNQIGYWLLRGKKYPESLAVFRKATALHPSSSNLLDSLAEALETSGDKAVAIEAPRKALDVMAKEEMTDAPRATARAGLDARLKRLQ